jgi:MGT family glycosyltransferase
MATILAYTSPAMGNLYPILALLTELHQRGHRIVLRTLTEGVPVGSELAFDSSAVDPRIEAVAMTDWMAPNSRAAITTAFNVFAKRAAYEVDDLRAAIASEEPDVVIIDSNCWGAPAAAEASALPWASFWSYPPFLKSRSVPPFGPGLRPWPGLLGRLRDEALRPIVTGLLEKAMVEPLNRIHTAVGVKPIGSSDEFIRRATLMLVASAEPFEYPHPDWDDAIQMIGPCEFDPPFDGALDWIDDIDRPIVLVTTSSERQGDASLPLAAMKALADEPVHVVATFPCGVPEGITIPDHATVKRFVPHGILLDRAVCAVTHGGMGATQKALARGVPVCVVPFGRDQFEVARRVDVSRSGTRLPAKKLTPSRLRSKIIEAMSMGEGASRVATGLAAAGGVARGADLLERRLLGLGPAAKV